jgi:hypothetical protein
MADRSLIMLFAAALQAVELRGTVASADELRRRRVVEHQIQLVTRALSLLKSLHTDIEALRIDGGDGFGGTGDCEFGHEACGVNVDWPNLAIDSDAIADLLKSVDDAGKELTVWYVLYGSGEFFKAFAEDREHAMEQCRDAYPGETVHVAVPANEFGGLVMHGYGEEFVTCPKCCRRTEMGELPVEGMQIHVCQPCDHSFIAVPDEEEVAA